jgi:hypothetical protein
VISLEVEVVGVDDPPPQALTSIKIVNNKENLKYRMMETLPMNFIILS